MSFSQHPSPPEVPPLASPSEGQARPADVLHEQVGRYIVLRRLGAGGMGVVDEALDPLLQRRVALKRLLLGGAGSHLSSDGEAARALLVQEARTLAKLDHPNIIKVLDAGVTDDGIFVAMELVQGETLRHKLRREKWGWKKWLEIYLEAAQGLAAAHRAQIIHRDFKPDNVMIDGEGRVLILDFGLASQVLPSAAGKAPALSRVATSDASDWNRSVSLSNPSFLIGGTPAYMSKEQRDGAPPNAASDQYSFCVSLFESIFGRKPPLDPQEHVITLEPHVNQQLFGRKCPPWLYDLLVRGMQADPERRLASMDEWIAQARANVAPRQTMAWAIGLTLLCVSGTALASRAIDRTSEARCQAFVDEGQSMWNEQLRARVEAAFLATGLPFARQALALAEQSLTHHQLSWQEQRMNLCLAAPAGDSQHLTAYEQRGGCFRKQLQKTQAVVELLAHAGARDVERVHDVVAALPDPNQCNDRHFRDPDPLVAGQDNEEAARALRQAWQDFELQTMLGQIHDPLQKGEELLRQAQLASSYHLVVDILSRVAHWAESKGDYGTALGYRRQGYALAQAIGYEERAVTIASIMVFAVAVPGRDPLEAEREWLPTAYAAYARARVLPPDAEIALLANQGVLYAVSGRLPQAVGLFERVVENLADVYKNEWPSDRLIAHNNLARGLMVMNNEDRAAAILRDVITRVSEMWGDRHPDLALPLGNIVGVEGVRGNFAQARRDSAWALEVAHLNFGADSTAVLEVMRNLVDIAILEGEKAQILADAQRYCESVKHTKTLGLQGRMQATLACIDFLNRAGAFDRALEIWATNHQALVEAMRVGEPLFFASASRYLETLEAAQSDAKIRAWVARHDSSGERCENAGQNEFELRLQAALAKHYAAANNRARANRCLDQLNRAPFAEDLQAPYVLADLYYVIGESMLRGQRLQLAEIWTARARAAAKCYAPLPRQRFCQLWVQSALARQDCLAARARWQECAILFQQNDQLTDDSPVFTATKALASEKRCSLSTR